MSTISRVLISKPSYIFSRFYNKIVTTDDGSTIVALHKESEFPYEYSKPLPEIENQDDTVLKMTDFNEVKRVFTALTPDMARQQLSSITLTTPHRWFPRARDKRAKKGEMNRQYL